MTDFVSDWNTDSFLTYPVGPLGLIAMPGTEELGRKINSWLKNGGTTRKNRSPETCGHPPALNGRIS